MEAGVFLQQEKVRFDGHDDGRWNQGLQWLWRLLVVSILFFAFFLSCSFSGC